MWTPKMEKELSRMHNQHLEDKKKVVGSNKKYSHGLNFSAANAVKGLKEKFSYLKKNDGFNSVCVANKVSYLGLKKL